LRQLHVREENVLKSKEGIKEEEGGEEGIYRLEKSRNPPNKTRATSIGKV
jgi:hypothetical protein